MEINDNINKGNIAFELKKGHIGSRSVSKIEASDNLVNELERIKESALLSFKYYNDNLEGKTLSKEANFIRLNVKEYINLLKHNLNLNLKQETATLNKFIASRVSLLDRISHITGINANEIISKRDSIINEYNNQKE